MDFFINSGPLYEVFVKDLIDDENCVLLVIYLWQYANSILRTIQGIELKFGRERSVSESMSKVG